MIGADIVLTMGKSTAAEVNADLISQWVTVDENVQAVLDEEAMRAWVDKLAGDCDTVGTTRTYTRADGKTITVSGGVYGWSIDYDALMDLVINGVKEGLVETVEIPNATSGDATALVVVIGATVISISTWRSNTFTSTMTPVRWPGSPTASPASPTARMTPASACSG